jgi:hypothetical protein
LFKQTSNLRLVLSLDILATRWKFLTIASLFQIYCWPIIETLFSEVLTKEEWLRVWDHIFSNHPSFLLLLVAAYLICSRKVLMQCTAKEDFEVSYAFIGNGSIACFVVVTIATTVASLLLPLNPYFLSL